MVGVGGQPVGGDAALEGQGVADALFDQSGHCPVDGGRVRRLVAGQTLADPLVNFGDRQMPVDGRKHPQRCDPRWHPPQPVGAQTSPIRLRTAGSSTGRGAVTPRVSRSDDVSTYENLA